MWKFGNIKRPMDWFMCVLIFVWFSRFYFHHVWSGVYGKYWFCGGSSRFRPFSTQKNKFRASLEAEICATSPEVFGSTWRPSILHTQKP
jgi:hypothetical protein